MQRGEADGGGGEFDVNIRRNLELNMDCGTHEAEMNLRTKD